MSVDASASVVHDGAGTGGNDTTDPVHPVDLGICLDPPAAEAPGSLTAFGEDETLLACYHLHAFPRHGHAPAVEVEIRLVPYDVAAAIRATEELPDEHARDGKPAVFPDTPPDNGSYSDSYPDRVPKRAGRPAPATTNPP